MCGATPLTDGGGIGNGAAAAAKRDIGLFKCVICCGVSGVGRATDDDVTSPGSTLLNSAAAAGDVAAEEMSFSGDDEETADVTATESLFPIILSIENVDLRVVVVVAPLAAGVCVSPEAMPTVVALTAGFCFCSLLLFCASSLASASRAHKLLDFCDFDADGGGGGSGGHCGSMRSALPGLKPTWNGGSGDLTRSSGERSGLGMTGSAPG